MEIVSQSSDSLYHEYVNAMQRIADIKHAAAVLQWDQETYLPSKGAAGRARQLATLTETAHQLFTNGKFGSLLNELSGRNDLDFRQQKNVSLTKEEYDKQKKFSSEFVRKMSETVSESFHAWIESRKENNFKIFEPVLAKLLMLKKEEAEILGYQHHPYNALLNEFEKGVTIEILDKVFDDITPPLKQIIKKIQDQPEADNTFLYQHFPKQQQWEWGMYIVKELGFDFNTGRQDISEHPFTTSFGAKDVRITTRINENNLTSMTWGCIHETGHALYEQGLPDEYYGLPSGEFASLGIHESQSRLWENCVGRSYSFWQYYFPKLKEFFPQQFEHVSLQQFYRAINKVQPSLIRIEADELTYHFHVKVRYIIEKELLENLLSAKDIPSRWNGLYKENLHVIVPDDKRGCLQDVHWSEGLFGYFPTYSLGSFYAAQFWMKIKSDMPAIEENISNGDTSELLNWLSKNIYIHGRTFTSEELCKRITSNGIDVNFFIKYLDAKYNDSIQLGIKMD